MRTENLLELINVIKVSCGSSWTSYSTAFEDSETIADILGGEPSMQVDALCSDFEVYGSYIIIQVPSPDTVQPVARALSDMLRAENDFSYSTMLMKNTSPIKHEDWIYIIHVGSFRREEV